MFTVKDRIKSEYMVYDVKYIDSSEAYFLIYKKGLWQYIPARYYTPVEKDDDKND